MLEERLIGLGQAAESARDVAKLAVTLANKDVQDFANPQVGLFVENTWKLMPEMTPEVTPHSAGVALYASLHLVSTLL